MSYKVLRSIYCRKNLLKSNVEYILGGPKRDLMMSSSLDGLLNSMDVNVFNLDFGLIGKNDSLPKIKEKGFNYYPLSNKESEKVRSYYENGRV